MSAPYYSDDGVTLHRTRLLQGALIEGDTP